MSPVSRRPSITATLLRYLGTACKFRSMYPPDHPIVHRAMADLVQVIDLLLRDRETISFQIYEDTFFLENQMLPEESLRNAGLLKSCLERGVGVFTLHRGVGSADIDAFVSLITHPPSGVAGGGGAEQYLARLGVQRIAVAAPRTALPSELPVEVDPENAYEAGHVVVQELRAQAVRRQPLDMNKARIFLSAAIEVVLDNRSSLLALMANRDHDEHSSYHAVNVSILALVMGTRLGLDHGQLMALGMGALLHDIGKVRVPQQLLNRATEFSAEGDAAIRRHPVHGGNILRELDGLGRVAAMVALEHHVHVDGSGYPTLSAKATPHLFSRLVAVVDAYDTLTSARRGSQRALRPDLAMKWIAAGLGTVFDATAGKVFLQMMGLYPVGSLVELGTGELAVVLRPTEGRVDRPIVQVVNNGQLGHVIDLVSDSSQYITAGVDPADVNVDIEALLAQQPAA